METDRGKGGEGEGGEGEGDTRHPHPTRRSRSWHREGQPARAGIEEAEQELEGYEESAEGYGETSRGALLEVTHVGGEATPPEENADLPGLTPERAHLLLQGVYGDFPHHNDGLHLDGGISDNAAWERRWRRLAVQSAI